MMKKVLALLAVAGLLATASVAFAGKTIVNSKHDLSSTSPGPSGTPGTTTQICIYCHAPHNARVSYPLWNRIQPTSTFRLYSGLNMVNTSYASGFTADSTSLMCMSCHDGVTSLGAVHNAGAIEGNGTIANVNVGEGAVHTAAGGTFWDGGGPGGALSTSSTAFLGTNLQRTHPVNFPVSLADTQLDLNPGSGAAMGPGNIAGVALTTTFPLFRSTERGGGSRFLECGSCHAVHDSQYSPFLRDTMTKSQLCLGCHNK